MGGGSGKTDERTPLLGSTSSITTSCGSKGRSGCPRVWCRHVLGLWSFLGFAALFCMRTCLSVAMVAMVRVNDTQVTPVLRQNLTSAGCDSVPFTNLTTVAKVNKQAEFDWDEETQGIILGSFFYGYTVTQIPGGWLAGRIGGKAAMGVSVLMTSLLTLATPFAARLHLYALIATRVLQGVAQGASFPAMHAMWGVWAPTLERSTLVSLTFAGCQVGTVVALFVSGYMCQLELLGGWPLIFYIFGGVGCLWCLGWLVFTASSPALHPRISREERDFIESSIGRSEKVSPPWCRLLTSPAVLAIALANVANDWGSFTLMSCLPTFMRHILQYDITQDGSLSAIPYVLLWLVNMVAGPLADVLLRNGLLSTKNTRKLLNTLGLFLPAGLMAAVGSVGCDRTLVIVILTAGLGLSGLTVAGYSVNHLDIAPALAGTLMGVTNTFGTASGFAGPHVVGYLTNDNETKEQWVKFFYITAGVYVLGGLAFLFMGQGEELSWYKEALTSKQTYFSVQAEDGCDRDSYDQDSYNQDSYTQNNYNRDSYNKDGIKEEIVEVERSPVPTQMR